MGETSEGVQTDGWTEREMRGDWSHLYGPRYCYACGQNPFECGCLNVNFESWRERKRREDRERERGTRKMHGTDQAEVLNSMREEMAECRSVSISWKELRGKAVVVAVGLVEMNGLGGMGLGGSGRNQG